MSVERLNLNEALVIVNKINLTSPFDVYYQINECYGCLPLKLESSNILLRGDNATINQITQQDQFVINTRHNFLLELRSLGASQSSGPLAKVLCRLLDVSLNSHGQYRLNVKPIVTEKSVNEENSSLNCELETIDSGECLLCPFAILICILFALVVFEQIYEKFWRPRRESALTNAQRRVSGKLSATGPKATGDEACTVSDDVKDDHRHHRFENPTHLSQDNSHQPTLSTMDSRRATDGFETSVMNGNSTNQEYRIECLDIFRGFTLAGMIFVNYGGAGYTVLEHKAWDGITLADFVFPFFIFSMGASIAISCKSLIRRHQRSFHTVVLKIFRRSFILEVLGICLNSKWVDYGQADGFGKLRLTGVLQRFSISYLVIAFVYSVELTINKWTCALSLSNVPYLGKLISNIFELLAAIGYITIYVYLTFYFDFNPTYCPIGYVGPGGATEGGRYANCTGGTAAWLDKLILGTNHMYNDHEVKETFRTQVSHDPEGILGYTTSILLTLIGLQCGKTLINNRQTHKQKLISLSQFMVALSIASSLVIWIPINKRLWSLTFIIVTALASFAIITVLYIFLDIYRYRKSFVMRLFSSAGKNSIFLYVGHSLIYHMLPWWFPLSNQTSHLQLLLRLSWSTFMWLLISHYMALKGIFIKI